MDYNATTPLHQEVREAMIDAMERLWRNPSSSYCKGKSTNQPINRSINQSTDQLTNQPINQPINQSTSPTNQPTNQPHQLINQSIKP
jgi:cysteine sulfinate desulfinase/cysteine desulfurase-like protein